MALGRRGLAAVAGHQQRGDDARGEHRRADPQRRDEAVGEGLRRGVGAAPAKTVERTETPSTPPISRIVLVAPDACPASLVRTEERTALAAGANTSAMPAPAITNGTSSEL